MEKLSSNRAQLFLRNKYTVFTMGGTVALRSVNKKNPESYISAANSMIYNLSSKLLYECYQNGELLNNALSVRIILYI